VAFACLPLAPFRSLAEAAQRGYLVNLWLIAQSMTAAAAALVLAYAGWGLTGQFAALALAAVVFYLGTTWDGLRQYPELLSRGSRSREIGTALWALSWPTLLFNLSGRVGLMTDEIVVAAVMGPAAVASFFLTLRVIALVGTQVLAVGVASWAGLMDLHFRGERDVFNHRLVQLTRATAILGAGGLVPVAIWNRDLIELWVGEEQYAGALVTGLGALTVWAQALVALWGWPLMAAGLVRAYLPAIATSAAVNLAVSVAATFAVGLPGPLIGTCVAVIGLGSWWTLVLLRLHFRVPVRRLALASLTPALLMVPYGAGLILLADAVPAYDPTWPRWAGLLAVGGWVGVAALGYLVLAWFLAFPAADRSEWRGRFRGWWRRDPA
jgi:O-antigen/teichoic acid export membrane protein